MRGRLDLTIAIFDASLKAASVGHGDNKLKKKINQSLGENRLMRSQSIIDCLWEIISYPNGAGY